MPMSIGQAPESDFSDPLGMLSDCHRRIARFLEAMIAITEEARGRALVGEKHEALATALKYFREAAPKHTADEEDSLFPRMKVRAEDAGKQLPVLTVLHTDHVSVVEKHHDVDALAQRWLIEDVLNREAADRMLELLYGLRETYQEHIEIEETKLFPLAARVLTSRDLHEIGKEMAHRRGLAPVDVLDDELC